MSKINVLIWSSYVFGGLKHEIFVLSLYVKSDMQGSYKLFNQELFITCTVLERERDQGALLNDK